MLISQGDADSKERCRRLQYEMNILGIDAVVCSMTSMYPVIENIEESVGKEQVNMHSSAKLERIYCIRRVMSCIGRALCCARTCMLCIVEYTDSCVAIPFCTLRTTHWCGCTPFPPAFPELFRRTGASSITSVGSASVTDFAKAVRTLVETGGGAVEDMSQGKLRSLSRKLSVPLFSVATSLSPYHHCSSFAHMHREDNVLVYKWCRPPEVCVSVLTHVLVQVNGGTIVNGSNEF